MRFATVCWEEYDLSFMAIERMRGPLEQVQQPLIGTMTFLGHVSVRRLRKVALRPEGDLINSDHASSLQARNLIVRIFTNNEFFGEPPAVF